MRATVAQKQTANSISEMNEKIDTVNERLNDMANKLDEMLQRFAQDMQPILDNLTTINTALFEAQKVAAKEVEPRRSGPQK